MVWPLETCFKKGMFPVGALRNLTIIFFFDFYPSHNNLCEFIISM